MKQLSSLEEAYQGYLKQPAIHLSYETFEIHDYRIPQHRLIYLASRPEVGKTNLALNIASRIISRYQQSVAYFTFEMSGFAIYESMAKICDNNRYVMDRLLIEEARCSAGEIVAKLKDKTGIAMIFIDTLRGLKTYGTDKHSYSGMMALSTELEIMRENLPIPICVLCHLKKDKGGHKQVVMEDIRGVGIEESGDLIFGLYRRELDPFIGEEEKFRVHNQLNVDCIKNRFGQKYKHTLYFDKETLKITE